MEILVNRTIDTVNKRCFVVAVFLTLITLIGCSLAQTTNESPVKIWEEPLTIPTYRVDPPDLNPIFYSGEEYQGAMKIVYPYPFLDKLTGSISKMTM